MQRKWVLVAIAMVALGAAAYLALRPRSVTRIPSTKSVYAVCLACKHEFEAQATIDAEPPFKCAACGQVAAYPVYYCFDTRHLFVPDLQRSPGEPPRVKYPVVSPFSHNGNVGAFPLGDPELQGLPKPKLPKWP